MNSWKVAVLSVDTIILSLVLLVAPQRDFLANLGSGIIILVCMTAILTYGIPSIHEQTHLRPELILAMILGIPYLAVLFTGASGIGEFPMFLIWYLIPSFLMLLSGRIQNKWVSSLLLIGGAGMLWIGFDHRYTRVLFEGYSDDYLFNSIWMAAVALVSIDGKIQTNQAFDNGIYPTKEGTRIANIVTPIASLIIVPFGLVTGFLQWKPKIEATAVIVGFIGIFLTISLQEELIFRGITLRELDRLGENITNHKIWGRVSLVMVSILFSLTHWNNESNKYVWHYFFAAFIAGLAYGIAYRRGGMFGAMLSHTLVDWVWALLLKRSN